MRPRGDLLDPPRLANRPVQWVAGGMPGSMRALLLVLAAVACNAALAAPCNQVFSASSGRLSLSGGTNCSALILPPYFYAAPGPIGGDDGAVQDPGGVAVAKVLGADGMVTCAGALIAPNMVLTAARCSENSVDVMVGDERFRVEEKIAHPVSRGVPEGLAVLRLAGASHLAPARIDTGESIAETCQGDKGKGLSVALANSLSGNETGWLAFEFSKEGQCGEAGEKYSTDSKLLCGATGENMAGSLLLGAPLIAGDVLLVGIVTNTSQGTVLLSRVSAQAQWTLAVMQRVGVPPGWAGNATLGGGAVFPARKLVLDVTSFDAVSSEGPWTVRVHAGASFSAPQHALELHPGSSFFFITLNPGVGWYKTLCALNTRPPQNRFTILRSCCSSHSRYSLLALHHSG